MSITQTVTTAARNAWALSFGEGIEPVEPTPSTVLFDEPHRLLRRYDVDNDCVTSDSAVLLVPPLAAPATCFDLRPDQSLARHLVNTGHAPYLVDYGDITFADRAMGFEDWVNDILPEAILRASADRGGAPVDLIGWSIGGLFSLLTAAANPTLPIRSVTALGVPLDYNHMVGMPQVRAVASLTGGKAVTAAVRAIGGIPAPLTRFAYRVTAFDRELSRPWFVASNIAKTETLAKMESIDRFMAAMPGYPGRFYGQVWGRLILANDLRNGFLQLRDQRIHLDEVRVPVLLVGGTTDVITPKKAVEAGLKTLTGSPSVTYEVAPGSHLGILAGETARDTTWVYLDKFLGDR
ncbi:alpha/beta fold hydrolase [Nocardia camponoti]|uniref:Hydrolase n=1 Tax=Nocardia camponoti TaxID=1616106 RepID=A0A917QDX5_9NOCA|nr:alpha/beta fold hydrolase [Nocardia camponoti]GGK45915.1 putative hydrolase [Nocardia camponoti]